MGPILTGPFSDLLVVRRPDRGSRNSIVSVNDGGSSSGMALKTKMVSAPGGSARVRVHYNAHLPVPSLQDREKSRTLLAGMVLPILHGNFFARTGTCSGFVGRNTSVKNRTSLTL